MTRVFLGSLGDEVEEETLRSYCSGWGELYSCTLMLEPGTSNSRGFAFLTFKSRSSASSFLSSQPHFIGDRKLIVKPLEMTSGTATRPKHSSNELFISYSRPSTSDAECEQLLSQHFLNCSATNITFGSDAQKQTSSLGYAVVEFADDVELDKYLRRGFDHEIESGIRLTVRRIASSESELKRKRKHAEEEAERQAEQERVAKEEEEQVSYFQTPSLLSSSSAHSKPKIPRSGRYLDVTQNFRNKYGYQ